MSNPELQIARELLEKVGSEYGSTLGLVQTYASIAAVEAQEQMNALLERQATAMESIASVLNVIDGSMREYVLPSGSRVLAFHSVDIGRKKVVFETTRLPEEIRGTLAAALKSFFNEHYGDQKICDLTVEAKEWLDKLR